MSFFAIQKFLGLDSRRSEYTSTPGSLVALDNCHINEGGEAEKRNAFVRGTGLTSTFGLVAGSASLYVFGSVANPGGFPVTIDGETVNYVRCQHPDGATAMTGVVSGTTFAGLPFVLAQFADGNTYPFYNGTLVSDFTSGLVLASLNTNTKIGTAFAGLINTLSPAYTATDHVTGVVDVFNQPNGQASGYTSTVVLGSMNAGSGALANTFTSAGTPSVLLGAAQGQFTILSGTAVPGTNSVNSVKIFGKPTTSVSRSRTANVASIVLASATGFASTDLARIVGMTDSSFNSPSATITLTGSTITYANTGPNVASTPDVAGSIVDLTTGVEILNVAVDWTTDNAHTALAVAAQINSFTSAPDYVAIAKGGTVTLYTTAAAASTFNGLILQVTTTGNVCCGDCIFSATATQSFSQLFSHIYAGTQGGGNVDLMSGYGTSGTDVTTGLEHIAAFIRTGAASGGVYVAYAVNNSIRISKAVTRSDDLPININVIPNTGVGIATGSSNPITAIVQPTLLATTYVAGANGGNGTVTFNFNNASGTQIYNINVSGGVAPYTYNWQSLTPNLFSGGTNQQQGVKIYANGNTPSPTFATVSGVGVAATADFVCVVTDSAGNVATSNVLTVLFN